ncbi:MAG: adenosylcobalamin-dependent ribonucleoside-diphosphate reductase [Methanoculleaceae archaeon]
MHLTENARLLLKERYLLPGERPEDLFNRVAYAVGGEDARNFLPILKDLLFLPNSPTLMNAGTSLGQLSACFVLPVEDSMESIFTALYQMAVIHKTGGGTGFSFSKIRPKGDAIGETTGSASGPVSFIRVFNEATTAIRQGGRRRGANMAVLSVHHPDIMEFVNAKVNGGLENFNLSVALDSSFFRHWSQGDPLPLINPRDGSVWREEDPRRIWNAIGGAAWSCGDPGLLFLDEINRRDTVPGLGPITATNPCGEVPLLPYESCTLGSINLARFVRRGELDADRLRAVVRLAVDFLDRVIDVNRYPFPQIADATRRTRKIGLGVMGLAEALIRLGIPYASGEGIRWAEETMELIQNEARRQSRILGEWRGSFPAIEESIFAEGMRNATVTSIAPTGSLHIIAGTTSGIEPLFSLAYRRKIGDRVVPVIHPFVEEILPDTAGGIDVIGHIRRTGSVQDLPLPDDLKELLLVAAEIPPEHHIRIQAAIQKHVDNAVSKTVNVPAETGAAEICRLYSMAYRAGCKGITVYRYGSKNEQVLSYGCDICRDAPA